MSQEYFMSEAAKDLIRDKFNKKGCTMLFTHYRKYEFCWRSEGDLDFKIEASYGGDSDRIYRYDVSSGEYREFRSLSELKNAFTYIEIHDYTNQLIYSWED